MRMIAVTGGVAEGKSTVMGFLREMGRSTVSADDLARELFGRPEVNQRLALAAGVPGAIDARQLRDAMFADASVRRQVNAIMHPLVMGELLTSGAEFAEIPLLLEVCAQHLFDAVWVVTCGEEEQRRRLVARVGSEDLASAILNTQLPTEAKLPFATVVLRTNQGLEAVRRDISEALAADSE